MPVVVMPMPVMMVMSGFWRDIFQRTIQPCCHGCIGVGLAGDHSLDTHRSQAPLHAIAHAAADEHLDILQRVGIMR